MSEKIYYAQKKTVKYFAFEIPKKCKKRGNGEDRWQKIEQRKSSYCPQIIL